MPSLGPPSKPDYKKSMRQLTGRAWRGDNAAAALFEEVDDQSKAAWSKPLAALTSGDLHLLLSQRASLGRDVAHLLPLAVERIESDPLAPGQFFPGELLTSLGMLDEKLWRARPDLAARWAAALIRASEMRRSLSKQDREILDTTLEMTRMMHPFVEAAFKIAKKKSR